MWRSRRGRGARAQLEGDRALERGQQLERGRDALRLQAEHQVARRQEVQEVLPHA